MMYYRILRKWINLDDAQTTRNSKIERCANVIQKRSKQTTVICKRFTVPIMHNKSTTSYFFF